MLRSDVATALSISVPRSGVPGFVSVTATVLKLPAVLNTEPGFVVTATKAASERPRPIGTRTASTSSPVRAQVMRFVRKARSMGQTCARARYVCHRPHRSRSRGLGRIYDRVRASTALQPEEEPMSTRTIAIAALVIAVILLIIFLA